MSGIVLPGNANRSLLTVTFRDGTKLTMEADAGHFVGVTFSGAFVVLQQGNSMTAFPHDLISRIDAEEIE